MTQNKVRDGIYVSFHYLEKGTTNDDNITKIPFTTNEFSNLTKAISNQTTPDLKNTTDLDKIRRGELIPFHSCKMLNNRTYCGVFRRAYWGHVFENSKKGNIDAESLNLRDFCFFLYFTDNGAIFIGIQYLGNYGGYLVLSSVLKKFLAAAGTKIRSHSIRSDTEDLKNTVPTEVKIALSNKGKRIEDGGSFSTSSLIAFKKTAGDESFELTVREKILSLIGSPVEKIKKEIAKVLNKDDIFTVSDDDVNDCKVVVRNQRGGTKTIYLFDQGYRATMYFLTIQLDNDGKLKISETIDSMIEKFNEEVIPKIENGIN